MSIITTTHFVEGRPFSSSIAKALAFPEMGEHNELVNMNEGYIFFLN